MRLFVTYLFLVSFILHSGSRLVVQIHFELNQEYIAANLCENREVPQMECNGSCHLKKELKKEDDRKEKTVKTQVELFPVIQSHQILEFDKTACKEKVNQTFFASINAHTNACEQSIFHPPILSFL